MSTIAFSSHGLEFELKTVAPMSKWYAWQTKGAKSRKAFWYLEDAQADAAKYAASVAHTATVTRERE